MEGTAEILDQLQEAYDLLTSSLLVYLVEVSNPLTNSHDKTIGEALARIGAEDPEARAAIAELIDELRGVPETKPFEMGDAHYNYLNVEYLLGMLLKRLRDQMSTFERLARDAYTYPKAADLLSRLASRRAQHIQALEAAMEAKRKAASDAAKPSEATPAPKPAAAPKPAGKAIDPERLAALKAAAEKKRASLAAVTKEGGAGTPPA